MTGWDEALIIGLWIAGIVGAPTMFYLMLRACWYAFTHLRSDPNTPTWNETAMMAQSKKAPTRAL